MNPPEPTPLHCRPRAFEALAAELGALDTTRGLLRCSVAVSMHQLDDADMDDVEAQIDALAGGIAERVQGHQPRALLAHAHAVLFDEARFAGNTQDYYSPFNSYLPRVLKTRLGLPITLVLLYKCVLESVGLRVWGINMPGHFLAAVRDGSPTPGTGADAPAQHAGGPLMLIDPFDGGKMLTRDDAFARLEQIAGGAVARDDALLRPATHTQWLTRILQNLAGVFDQLERPDDTAAMREMIALVESVS
ncbi:MAG: transglutaminase-like domain-containing protein [Planctomycetota bacterium]